MPLFDQPSGGLQIAPNPRLAVYGSQPPGEADVVGKAGDDAYRRSTLAMDDFVARPARREAEKQDALDRADRAIANRAVRPVTTAVDIRRAQDELAVAPAKKELLLRQIADAGNELDVRAATAGDRAATAKAAATAERAAAEGVAASADAIRSAAGAKPKIDLAAANRVLADPEGNRAELVKLASSLGIAVAPEDATPAVAEKVRKQVAAMYQMKAWTPKDQVEQENALRKEFEGSTEFKNFKEQKQQYSALRAALGKVGEGGPTPSAYQQQAAAHAFLKMMDPTLAVRGTSYDTLEHAAGKPAQWQVEIQNLLNPNNPVLLPDARLRDMKRAADVLFAENQRAFRAHAQSKRAQAAMYPGVRPDSVFAEPADEAAPTATPAPAAPAGGLQPPVPGAVLHSATVGGKPAKVWVAPDGKFYPAGG